MDTKTRNAVAKAYGYAVMAQAAIPKDAAYNDIRSICRTAAAGIQRILEGYADVPAPDKAEHKADVIPASLPDTCRVVLSAQDCKGWVIPSHPRDVASSPVICDRKVYGYRMSHGTYAIWTSGGAVDVVLDAALAARCQSADRTGAHQSVVLSVDAAGRTLVRVLRTDADLVQAWRTENS